MADRQTAAMLNNDIQLVAILKMDSCQQRRYLAFVRGIHRWPVNYPHKWPVTRKKFPFDDAIMPVLVAPLPGQGLRQCAIGSEFQVDDCWGNLGTAKCHVAWYVGNIHKLPLACLKK